MFFGKGLRTPLEAASVNLSKLGNLTVGEFHFQLHQPNKTYKLVFVSLYCTTASLYKSSIIIEIASISIRKNVLFDKIEHAYLPYYSNLVVNSCVLIFNPHKYQI